MWVKFPLGTTAVSIEQQQFVTEVTGADGSAYFRIPDHFAGKILSVPGFSLCNPPPGAPADLPKADPDRDNMIAKLSVEVQGLTKENTRLGTELTAALLTINSLENKIKGLIPNPAPTPVVTPAKK